MKEGVMKEVNAKAFRAHRELRIMFAAWNSVSSVACDLLYNTTKLFLSLSLWFK